MNRTSLRTGVGRAARDLRRRVGAEIRRLRIDANVSQRALAAAAGIDHAYLSQLEAGSREPSYAVLLALGDALGADVQVQLYPTSGPRIRDRIQAAMVEALLGATHRRWTSFAEVAVHRPARGFVDVVLADPSAGVVVATEAHSEIRRLEQHLRWAQEKADSLPSSPAWSLISVDQRPRISRLLLLRSTRTTRDLARTFESTLAVAYPARTADIFRALITPDAPWPAAGILWVAIEAGRARILDRPPRGVALGR